MKTLTMTQTMNDWQSTFVGSSVVPAYGFSRGEVRLDAAAFACNVVTDKRHAVAIKATPATGPQPWSPPVT